MRLLIIEDEKELLQDISKGLRLKGISSILEKIPLHMRFTPVRQFVLADSLLTLPSNILAAHCLVPFFHSRDFSLKSPEKQGKIDEDERGILR
ncbi:MAG: hypothetical protein Q4A63_05440 [Butyricicoccus pullicaecorum]|nr:hypothetical protein [Butyricicoccus pullicaecorum]MDO4669240.1 hypothetical protein [Butyricicoccus pullicaecorum]